MHSPAPEGHPAWLLIRSPRLQVVLHWLHVLLPTLFQKLALQAQAAQPAVDHAALAGRLSALHGTHTVSLLTVHAWVWMKPGPHTLHATHLASAVVVHGWRKLMPLEHTLCVHWMQASPEER
jgi:hypothetical protein